MRRRMLRALALALLMTLLAGALTVASAATRRAVIADYVLWKGCGPYMLEFSVDPPDDAHAFSISSSNRDVVKVSIKDRNNVSSVQLMPLKTGKSRITLKYKSAGRTQQVSKVFTVKRYPEPFDYIKVNGKKINLDKNRSSAQFNGYSKDTVTVSFRPSIGWEIDGYNGTRFKNGRWTGLKWKNGKKIDLAGYKAANLVIDLRQWKTGNHFKYTIYIRR